MSEFKRLEDKLQKLAERERGKPGPRTLAASDGEALLTRIILELDEVILPRRVNFKTPAGAVVSFAVASRRLQAFLAPVPEAASSIANLAGIAFGAGDDETLGRLKDALLAVLGDANEVTVWAERQKPESSFPAESGVPVAGLARSWGLSLEDLADAAPDPLEALARFLGHATPATAAWLRIDGEDVSGSGGDHAAIARLGEGLGGFLDTFFQKRSALALHEGTPTCLAVETQGSDHVVVLAHNVAAMAVLLVPTPQAADVLGHWQASLRAG